MHVEKHGVQFVCVPIGPFESRQLISLKSPPRLYLYIGIFLPEHRLLSIKAGSMHATERRTSLPVLSPLSHLQRVMPGEASSSPAKTFFNCA